MRARPLWLVVFVVAVALAGAYGYYKLSSIGYGIGLAKHGHVVATDGKPVSGAWVISQWLGYTRGVHGGPTTVIYAGSATQTDAEGTYSVPAMWHLLGRPLNQLPYDTGHYAFGLLVYKPGVETDPARPPACERVGSPQAPFICPDVLGTKGLDGNVIEELTDIALTPAHESLQGRARMLAVWNRAAFIETASAPALSLHGPVRARIAQEQLQELTELACREEGQLPYVTFLDLAGMFVRAGDRERFLASVIGADKIQNGVDISCRDTADRCPPVDAQKVCTALKSVQEASIQSKENR